MLSFLTVPALAIEKVCCLAKCQRRATPDRTKAPAKRKKSSSGEGK